MDERVYITLTAVAVGIAVLTTGWWRAALAPFRIRVGSMTVARLGLRVKASADIDRVNELLHHFASGFNSMITARSESVCRRLCQSVPVLYRPFAEEGAAMGYTLRHFFRYKPTAFENRMVKPNPEFRYLYYVGLGFWSGMRNHSPRRMERVAEGLDPLHRFLCFDGYGFKRAFFDYPNDPSKLDILNELEGYARNAAYQGVGRAFYFRFMADADEMIDHIRRLGVHAADAAAGVGLAAVFVNPDRLEVARTLASKMPADLRSHFHLGMCFGLKARSINNVEEFERHVDCLDSNVRDAVLASIRECDRIELLIRSSQDPEAYRLWRETVTEWMGDHVVYPMGGLKLSPRIVVPEPQALTCGDFKASSSRETNPSAGGKTREGV